MRTQPQRAVDRLTWGMVEAIKQDMPGKHYWTIDVEYQVEDPTSPPVLDDEHLIGPRVGRPPRCRFCGWPYTPGMENLECTANFTLDAAPTVEDAGE